MTFQSLRFGYLQLFTVKTMYSVRMVGSGGGWMGEEYGERSCGVTQTDLECFKVVDICDPRWQCILRSDSARVE